MRWGLARRCRCEVAVELVSRRGVLMAAGTLVQTIALICHLKHSLREAGASLVVCPLSVPSLYLPCTFPGSLPTLRAPCTFPVPSLYLPCTFPVPSLYLPCTFPVGSLPTIRALDLVRRTRAVGALPQGRQAALFGPGRAGAAARARARRHRRVRRGGDDLRDGEERVDASMSRAEGALAAARARRGARAQEHGDRDLTDGAQDARGLDPAAHGHSAAGTSRSRCT